MKKGFHTVFLLTISVLLIYACHPTEDQRQNPALVKIDTASQAGITGHLPYPGKIMAAAEVNLAFRIAGPIKTIGVEEGQSIKKGQLLAEIDPRDYQIQLAATKAEYQQIKAEAERVVELYKRKSVSTNDYDKAVSGLNRITAKLNAHQNALNDTRLLAPFDGFVQKKYFDAHETVDAGMPVIALVNTTWLEVVIDIPANEYINSDNFESFWCEADVYEGQKFPLELLEINKQSNLNQLFKVRLKLLPHKDYKLAPGMSVNVTINSLLTDDHLVQVPLSAVFESNGHSCVWLYDSKTMVIHKQEVIIKEILKHGNVIISKGLTTGDQVISAGVHTLQEGQKAEPLKAVSKTNVGGML